MSSRKPYKSCRKCPSASNKSQTLNNASASSGTRVTATAQLSSTTSRFSEASGASVTKVRTGGSGHGAQTSKIIISGMGLKPGSLKVTTEIPYTSKSSPKRSRQSRSTSVYPKVDRVCASTCPDENFNLQESISIQEAEFTVDDNNYDIITTEEEVNMQESPGIDLPRAPPGPNAWYEEDEFNISPLKSDDDDLGGDETDADITPLEMDIDFNYNLYSGVRLTDDEMDEEDFANLSPLSDGDDYGLGISPVPSPVATPPSYASPTYASPCADDCAGSPMSAGLSSPDRSPPISYESPIPSASPQNPPRVIPETAPARQRAIRASGLRQPETGLRPPGIQSAGSRAPAYAQPTSKCDDLCPSSPARSSRPPPQTPRVPIPSSRALLPQRLSIPQTQSEFDVEDTSARPSSRPAASQSPRGTTPETRAQQRPVSSEISSTAADSRPSTDMQEPSGIRPPTGMRPPSGMKMPSRSLRPSQDLTSRVSSEISSTGADSRPSTDMQAPSGIRPSTGMRPPSGLKIPSRSLRPSQDLTSRVSSEISSTGADSRPSTDMQAPSGIRPSTEMRPPSGMKIPSRSLKPSQDLTSRVSSEISNTGADSRPSTDIQAPSGIRPSTGVRPPSGLKIPSRSLRPSQDLTSRVSSEISSTGADSRPSTDMQEPSGIRPSTGMRPPSGMKIPSRSLRPSQDLTSRVSSEISSTGADSRPSTDMQAPSGIRPSTGMRPPSGLKIPSRSLRPSQDLTSRDSCPKTCPSNRRKSRTSPDKSEEKTSEDSPKHRSSRKSTDAEPSSRKSTDAEPSSPRSSRSRKSSTHSPRTTIESEAMEQSSSPRKSSRASAETRASQVSDTEPATPRNSTRTEPIALTDSDSVITEPEIIENQEERDVPPSQIDSPVGQIDARTALKMSRQIVTSSRGTVIDHSLLGMKTVEPGKARQIEMTKKELIPSSRLRLPTKTTLGTSTCEKSCLSKRQGPSSRIAPPRTQYTAAVAPVIEDVGEEVLPPEVSLDRPTISSPRMSGPQAPTVRSIPAPRQLSSRSGLRAPTGMRPPMTGRGSTLQPPSRSMGPPSQRPTDDLPEPRHVPVGQYYIPARSGAIANSPEQLKQKLTKHRPISLTNWKNEMQNYNQVFNAPLKAQHPDVVATNIVRQGQARSEELAEIERRRTSDILEETLDPNLPEEYWSSSLKEAMEMSEEANSPESYPVAAECGVECPSKSGRPQYSPERLPQSPQIRTPQGRLPTPPQAPFPQARRSTTPPQVSQPQTRRPSTLTPVPSSQARRSATPPQVSQPQTRRPSTPTPVPSPQARRSATPPQVSQPQTRRPSTPTSVPSPKPPAKEWYEEDEFNISPLKSDVDYLSDMSEPGNMSSINFSYDFGVLPEDDSPSSFPTYSPSMSPCDDVCPGSPSPVAPVSRTPSPVRAPRTSLPTSPQDLYTENVDISSLNEDDMAYNLDLSENEHDAEVAISPSPQPIPSPPYGDSSFSPAQPRQIIQGQVARAQKLQTRHLAQPQPQYGVLGQISPSRKPSAQQRIPAPSVTAPPRPRRIQAPSRPAICGVTCPSTRQGRRTLTPSPVSSPQSRRSPTPPRSPSPKPPTKAWYEEDEFNISPLKSDLDDISDLSDVADISSFNYSYDFGELPEGSPISPQSYSSSISPCDDICPGSPGPSYRLSLSSPDDTPPSRRGSPSIKPQRVLTPPSSQSPPSQRRPTPPSQRLPTPPSQRVPTPPSQRLPTPPTQRPPTPRIVPPTAEQVQPPIPAPKTSPVQRSLRPPAASREKQLSAIGRPCLKPLQRPPVQAIEEAPPDPQYVPQGSYFMPCSGGVDANSPDRLKERLSRYTPISLSHWKNVPQPQAQYPERQEALKRAHPDVIAANIQTRLGAPTAEELSNIGRRMKPNILDQTIDPYAADEEQYRAAEECYAEPPIESLYERQDQVPTRAHSERFPRASIDASADRPYSAPAAPAMTQPYDEVPEVYNEDEASKSILDEALLTRSITSHPYSPKSSPTPINLEISIEVPTSSVGADANIVKKLVDEERNDALVCKMLMSPFKDKLGKLKKKPQAVKLLEETMNQSIPGDDEGDSFKSDIMAALMATEEIGKINTTKSPKRTYETLFPALKDEPVLDVAPAGPAPLQDIVVPVGEAEVENVAIVNEDIKTTCASEDAISDMPPCDLYAESMARMKDDTEERKKSETEEKEKEKERIEKRRKSSIKALSTPRDESYIPGGELEEEKAPWEIDLGDLEELVGGQMSTMQEDLPSDESIRAIKGRLEYILEYEKPMHYSCVQLQGSQPPDWFPGYYSVFPQTPNYVQLEKSPSRVMQVAWNIFAPTDVFDNSEIIIT